MVVGFFCPEKECPIPYPQLLFASRSNAALAKHQPQ
jgi:hypothetical protein